MSELATYLLGAPGTVRDLPLGITLEAAEQLVGGPIERGYPPLHDVKKKLDGAKLELGFLVDESGVLRSVEARVRIVGTKAKPAKPRLAALEKELTTELTARHGKPRTDLSGKSPHWVAAGDHYLRIITWDDSNEANNKPDVQCLKLELVKIAS